MKQWLILLFSLIFVMQALCFELVLESSEQRTDGSGLFDVWYGLNDLETDECVRIYMHAYTEEMETLRCETFLNPASPGIICDNGLYHIVWNIGVDEPDREFKNNELAVKITASSPDIVPWICDTRVMVSGGAHYSLCLKENGSVWAWGSSMRDALGTGTATTNLPVRLSGIGGTGYVDDGIMVGATGYSGYVIREDHSMAAWGWNVHGELGDNTHIESRNYPNNVHGQEDTGFLENVYYAKTGYYNIAALKEDNTVLIWGYNSNGQLGNGSFEDGHFPALVKNPDGVTAFDNVESFAISDAHVLFIKHDNTVWSCGFNSEGQLGDGSYTTSALPVQVRGVGGAGFLSNIEMVATSGWGSIALCADSTVLTWGTNLDGALGNNTHIASLPFPVYVVNSDGSGVLDDIVKISSCGFYHYAVIKADGSVWTWGRNTNGELGDGTFVNRNKPVQVLGEHGIGYLENIIDVASGWNHTIAISSEGFVWTWGENAGCLGDGTFEGSNTPVRVLNPDGSTFFNVFEDY